MGFYADTFLPLDNSFVFSVLGFSAIGKKWEVVCTLRNNFFGDLQDHSDMQLDQIIEYVTVDKATSNDGEVFDAYQWLGIIKSYKLHASFSLALMGVIVQIFSALHFFEGAPIH
mgnify:CR=1 FL=1